MELRTKANYDELSAATADLIARQIQHKPDSLLCFPSGDTPTGTFTILVNHSKEGKISFSQCHFIGLDEWVGMDRNDKGSCQYYMYTQFFEPAKIPPSRITFFDAKATDLLSECKRVDQMIFDRGPLDLVIVGVGLNGHIGLNEPGTAFDTYCHISQLEETTKKVGQKYFSASTPLKSGITVGLKHIIEARCVVVIASGEKKAGIIKKIITGPVTEQVPGSILQHHQNAVFVLDEAAASQLKST